MNCFTFVFVQLLSVCHSKLVVSEAEWKEMNQHRTVDKILDQADLIESVTEVADWCPWVKVHRKYVGNKDLFTCFMISAFSEYI